MQSTAANSDNLCDEPMITLRVAGGLVAGRVGGWWAVMKFQGTYSTFLLTLYQIGECFKKYIYNTIYIAQ